MVLEINISAKQTEKIEIYVQSFGEAEVAVPVCILNTQESLDWFYSGDPCSF